MPKTENFQWYVEQVGRGEIHGHALTQTLVAGRSKFQEYAVVVSPVFGKMLVLDGDTQSSALDEYIYHESLVHPACVASGGAPKRALILGGGEGATLRELLRLPSMQKVTMVDIDGEVVDVCRRYLPEWSAGAFEDARTEVIVGDAKDYVFSSNEQFDVIIGDLTEPLEDSPSAQLHSPEMYARIRSRLAPHGAYALQASTAGPHNLQLHIEMVRKLKESFSGVYPYCAYVPAFDTEWGFAVCAAALDLRSPEAASAAKAYGSTVGGLKFYDQESHQRMFSLPRYLR
ncbi:MAG: methyltransferase domain-containing protein [Candidatus Eremiobacteraeota bacterium]|nr:methyltransferase domain-containing protein [Candidatus Eremiobacteraeota bacterium]